MTRRHLLPLLLLVTALAGCGSDDEPGKPAAAATAAASSAPYGTFSRRMTRAEAIAWLHRVGPRIVGQLVDALGDGNLDDKARRRLPRRRDRRGRGPG